MIQGESPIIDGTWYNPKTGDSFVVSDAFIQDNQYLIKARDGRLLDYNFIKDYIKSDKPIPKQTTTAPKQDLPKEVSDILDDGILKDDLDLISKPMGNLYDSTPSAPISTTSMNESIISKALAKKSQPLLDININWDDFPTKELDLLIDVMDIDPEEIISWYTSNIDIKEVVNIISESLVDYIKSHLKPQPKSVEEPAPKPQKKTKSKK